MGNMAAPQQRGGLQELAGKKREEPRTGQDGRFGTQELLKVTLQLLTPVRPIDYDIKQSFL